MVGGVGCTETERAIDWLFVSESLDCFKHQIAVFHQDILSAYFGNIHEGEQMRTGVVVFLVSIWGVAVQAAPTRSGDVKETISSVEQADALVRDAQKQFWRLVPPGMSLYVHSERKAHPMTWSSGWPDALKKQAYAEMQRINGLDYPIYRFWAEADLITGDLTYYNMHGAPVWTSLAPSDYSPYSYIMEQFNVDSVDQLTEEQKQLSASHVGLEILLTFDTIYEFYEQDLAYEAQEKISSSAPDGTAQDQSASIDYGDELYLVHNFSLSEEGWMDIHNAEVGQNYEIYFTDSLQWRPFSTNTSSDYTAWPAQVGLVGHSDEIAYWSAPMINENGMYREAGFFKAYSSKDSDGDGLSDIYELMMTKTDPFNAYDIDGVTLDGDVDMDGDGLTNREEYLGLGIGVYTHPLKFDTDGDGQHDGVDPWPMDGAGAVDTDGDGMPDDLYQNRISTSYPQLIADLDDDNDGFSDLEEEMMGWDGKDADCPGRDVYLDSDGDGLYDWEDPYPTDPDGDNDGIGDGYEVKVLGNSPTEYNNYTQAEKDAYAAVAGDSDLDGKPQWAEDIDSTNPNDGLDFSIKIF